MCIKRTKGKKKDWVKKSKYKIQMPTTSPTPSSSTTSSDNDSPSIATKVELLETRINSLMTNSGRSNQDSNANRKLPKSLGSKYPSFL